MTEEPTWHRGSWMQTFTGRQFYPISPRAEDVQPEDIAHSLSLICRYGGHCRDFYSVAEHCVLMSHAVASEFALAALLHDATEAYVGDMVRPLKQHMPDYRDVEFRVADAIGERFGIDPEIPEAVHEADNRILLDERAALFNGRPAAWGVEDLEPLGVRIGKWSPGTAEREYLLRLRQLGVIE